MLVVGVLDVAFARPKNGRYAAFWLSSAAPVLGAPAVLACLGGGKSMQLALRDLIVQTSSRLGRPVMMEP